MLTYNSLLQLPKNGFRIYVTSEKIFSCLSIHECGGIKNNPYKLHISLGVELGYDGDREDFYYSSTRTNARQILSALNIKPSQKWRCYDEKLILSLLFRVVCLNLWNKSYRRFIISSSPL
jgi:hypothetical protein